MCVRKSGWFFRIHSGFRLKISDHAKFTQPLFDANTTCKKDVGHRCCEETIPLLVWSSPIQVRGSKRLKTVSAQTDQTRVSSHPDGSSAVGFTIHTGCRRINCCIEEVRGDPQKSLLKKAKDFTLLQTTFTAFTEILQQYQNFLWEVGRGEGVGVDTCVKVGVCLLNSQTDGVKNWGFKTTLMIVKEKNHVIVLFFKAWDCFVQRRAWVGQKCSTSCCVGLFVCRLHGDQFNHGVLLQNCYHFFNRCNVLTWRWRSCWASCGPPEWWRRGRCQRFGAARAVCRCVAPGRRPGGAHWSRSRSQPLSTLPHLDPLRNQKKEELWLLIKGSINPEHKPVVRLKSLSFVCSTLSVILTPSHLHRRLHSATWCGLTGRSPPSLDFLTFCLTFTP